MTEEVRRLSESEIDSLLVIEGVKQDVILGIFKNPFEENSYDYNMGLLYLDASLLKWNKETVDACVKGFGIAYNHYQSDRVRRRNR